MALTKLNNQSLSAVTSAGLPSGTVLQVKQTVVDSALTVSAPGETTFVDISGMSVTITPSSASNKILIMYNIMVGWQNTGQNLSVRLARGSTTFVGTGGSNNNATSYFRTHTDAIQTDTSANFYLDSPASTNALTYKLQWALGSGNIYLNRRHNDSYYVTISDILAMEIAG